MPAVIGLVLAGIALNPFTPGYTVSTNQELIFIGQVGAILLMFMLGLQFDVPLPRRWGPSPSSSQA